MKNIFIVVATVFAIFINACTDGQSQTGLTNLSAADFQKKIQENLSVSLVDVRTSGEFLNGHLKNAVNIDISNSQFQELISKYDKSKPVFVYCLSGSRSFSAAKTMLSMGFKEVYNMEGGMIRWRSAGLPETTDQGTVSDGMNKAQYNALLNTEKMVLVDFYAEWCAPCKKMAPYLEELKKEMSSKLVVVRINVDENKTLCKEMKIDALPVLILYKNKTAVWNHSGFISKEDVVKQLK